MPDRRLDPSPFPDDDGTATAATRAALATADASAVDYLRAVAELCAARVLVPVVATTTRLGETTGGLVGDKEAEMAVVLTQRPDGRQALLVFTGMDSLQAWDPTARPVPVTLDLAARSAVSEDAPTLVVDVAGPHPLVVEQPLVGELAAGRRLVGLGGEEFGWAYAGTG